MPSRRRNALRAHRLSHSCSILLMETADGNSRKLPHSDRCSNRDSCRKTSSPHQIDKTDNGRPVTNRREVGHVVCAIGEKADDRTVQCNAGKRDIRLQRPHSEKDDTCRVAEIECGGGCDGNGLPHQVPKSGHVEVTSDNAKPDTVEHEKGENSGKPRNKNRFHE